MHLYLHAAVQNIYFSDFYAADLRLYGCKVQQEVAKREILIMQLYAPKTVQALAR